MKLLKDLQTQYKVTNRLNLASVVSSKLEDFEWLLIRRGTTDTSYKELLAKVYTSLKTLN